MVYFNFISVQLKNFSERYTHTHTHHIVTGYMTKWKTWFSMKNTPSSFQKRGICWKPSNLCCNISLHQNQIGFLSRSCHLEQRSVNYSPWGTSGQPPVFVNKLLLEHSQICSVTFCLWTLLCYDDWSLTQQIQDSVISSLWIPPT